MSVLVTHDEKIWPTSPDCLSNAFDLVVDDFPGFRPMIQQEHLPHPSQSTLALSAVRHDLWTLDRECLGMSGNGVQTRH